MPTELDQTFVGYYLYPLVDNVLEALKANLPPLITAAGLEPFVYFGTTHRVDELDCPRLSLLAADSEFADQASGMVVEVTHTFGVIIDITAEDPDEGRKDLTQRITLVDSELRKMTAQTVMASVPDGAYGDFQMRVNRHSYGQFPRLASSQLYLLRCEMELWIRYLTE